MPTEPQVVEITYLDATEPTAYEVKVFEIVDGDRVALRLVTAVDTKAGWVEELVYDPVEGYLRDDDGESLKRVRREGVFELDWSGCDAELIQRQRERQVQRNVSETFEPVWDLVSEGESPCR